MENSKLSLNDHCEVHIYKCKRCEKNSKQNLLFLGMQSKHIGKLTYLK